MKRLLFAFTLASISISVTATNIEGRIVQGPQSGTAHLYLIEDYFSWKTSRLSFAPIRSGRFKLEAPINHTSLYLIKVGTKEFKIYLEPNGSYQIELKPQGIDVITEPNGLNEKIKDFHKHISDFNVQSQKSLNELNRQAVNLRNIINSEPEGFFRNYALYTLADLEQSFRSIQSHESRKSQQEFLVEKLEPLLIKGGDLQNPAFSDFLSSYWSQLKALNRTVDADCEDSLACRVEQDTKVLDQVEDQKIRDLMYIQVVQHANNTKRKRDLAATKELLAPYQSSPNEDIKLIATNVEEWVQHLEERASIN